MADDEEPRPAVEESLKYWEFTAEDVAPAAGFPNEFAGSSPSNRTQNSPFRVYPVRGSDVGNMGDGG